MQGVFSRGDERVAQTLAGMEDVSLAAWRRAIEENQLDINYYVNQRWETGQKLPWSVIDSGMKEERLCQEMERAIKE
ncbi:MAG: hypothetical protein A2Z15_03720 [Chloroflexi bacterium RBG_16_50_11]|nr:MAG: hypothetical protein A2Z15_03720 [Chloroflexi bacterium RBG_16_50_11]